MRHKKHSDAGGAVNLSVIITPFLDMSFQLLSFFIMIYSPVALEGHIDGKLVPPNIVATKSKTPVEPNDIPSDADPDAADAVIVKIKAVPKGEVGDKGVDGEPSMILVKELTEESKISEGETMDNAMISLKSKLKSILDRGGGKSNIKLDADGNLRHRHVMRIYDVCKQAGYNNISFVAPPFVREKKE